MISTTVRQRIFRTDIPHTTEANKKQAQFFWTPCKFCFHMCCTEMQSHCVSSRKFQATCSFLKGIPSHSDNFAASVHLIATQRDKTSNLQQSVTYLSKTNSDSWWVLFYYASQRYVSCNAQIFFFNFTLQHIDISLNRETVLMTICFQICHTNTSFIQIAVSAKKYLCC